MTLGTRIAVMNEGRIEQVAAPLETFERPATAFVARFVGSPAMNLWSARVAREGDRTEVTTPAFALDVGMGGVALADGADVFVGIRPHEIRLTSPHGGDAEATVEVVEPLGAQATVHVSLKGVPGELTRVVVTSGQAPRAGDRVSLRLSRDRVHLFDRDGRRVE